ncbi:MAG: 3'-5' exonuclease, partial [Chloroflexi bacterium]|nr:3'-5' exonuclease [Chloroflexota bacterium]
MSRPETFVSIDIEASGPSPSTGSMIAIGACLVTDPEVGFYREIRPLTGTPWDSAAERVHRLTSAHLEEHGLEPRQAMLDLDGWLEASAPGRQPIFVGFNAAFDWMFVADYFHRFLGRNPFGISALDLKGLYMGRHALERWDATRFSEVRRTYPTRRQLTHHALD